MRAQHVSVPYNIPELNPQIIVIKKFPIFVTQTGATGFDLTYAKVALAVPGGNTYFNTMRVEKVQVWGAATNVGGGGSEGTPLTVTIPAVTSWNQPAEKFVDSGTSGSTRPKIGFKLGLLQASRFMGTSDTQIICNINQAPQLAGETRIVIHVTVELAGPIPSSP
jgi:hypothetical protein